MCSHTDVRRAMERHFRSAKEQKGCGRPTLPAIWLLGTFAPPVFTHGAIMGRPTTIASGIVGAVATVLGILGVVHSVLPRSLDVNFTFHFFLRGSEEASSDVRCAASGSRPQRGPGRASVQKGFDHLVIKSFSSSDAAGRSYSSC